MAFALEKAALLQRLAEGCDYSPKGNIDAPILPLVELINADPRFVTTSTCSGRVSVFACSGSRDDAPADVLKSEPRLSLEEASMSPGPPGQASPPGHGKGGGGRWVLASHGPVTTARVEQAVSDALKLCQQSDAILKHEPTILHVRCVDLAWATWLLKVVVGAGFRESGIVPGRTKVMLHVRTTATCLEVPLILNGTVLVTPSYLSVLTDIANGRFALNAERLQRLEDSIRTALAALPTPSPEEAACNTSAMGQPGAGWTATAGSSSTLAPTRAIATTTTAAAAAAASVEAAAAAARETTLAARAAVAATRGKASSSSLVTGAPPPGSKAAGRLAKSARVAAAKASAKALKRAVKMNYSNGTVDTTRNTDGSSSSTRSLNSITTRSSKKHQPSALNPDPGLSSASQLAGNATGPVWAASVALLNGSSRNEVGSIAPNNNSSSSSIKSEIDPCQWKVLSFGGFGPCQGGGSVRRLSASKTLHGTTHDYRVAAGAPMNVKVAAAAAANVTTGAEPCPRESAALAMLYAPGTGSSDIGPLRGPVAVLFGGRESPSKPLGDAWYWTEETPFSDSTTSSSTSSLCRSNGSWRALQRPSSPSFSSSSPHHFGIEVAGEWPCPRWGHTLTSLGPGVLLLFGGCDHLGTVGVNSNDSGSEGDADDGRGVAYLLIANSKDSVHDTGKRIAWRWQRLSLTAGAIAAATGSANLARFDHSATLVPISAASFTADKVFSVASQFNSTVVVYGGWHDAAVDVQPSASVVVLDLTIDFDDAKQLLKANTCRIRRPLGVAHPSLPLLTSREGHSNILRRANHSAVGLATHLVVFGGAGDSVSGDDSLAAFALPWTALLSQGGDHNNSSDGGVGVGVGVGNDESEASSKDGNGSTSIVVAEAIQWADGSSGGGGGGFLEAFVKGAAVALPPAPPAPWSTLMSPGSLSVSNEGHDDAANAASSSSSSNDNNHSGSRGSAGNDVVSAAAWAVGTPPCSARGEQRALLLGGGLPLLGFGPHFCAHTTTAAVVTLRFASKDDNSSHAVGHTTTTTTTTTTNTANTVSSSNNSSPHAIADSSSDRMVHTAWFEPISFGHSDSDGAATPTLKSEESRETAEPAAGVSWAAEVRARSRRKHGAAAAVALSAQSGQSGQPASLVSTSSQASTKVPATSQGTNSRAFDTFVAKVSTAERRTGHNNNQMADTSSCEVVAAPANATKKLKAALEACGYLDKGWRIAPAAGAIPETLAAAKMSLAKDSNEEFTLDYTGWLALPLTTDGTAAVDAALAAISDAATAAVDCEETVAQAAAVSSGASRVLTTALVGAMRSVVITSTTVAIPPDGSAPGSDSTGKAKLGAESPLRWPLLPRGRAVDGGLPLNKAKLSGQRSKLECAVVALLLEAHHQNLLHTANSSSQMMSQGRSTNASGDKKIVEAALRTAVLSSSLFAGSNNLERVGDTAILLPEACLPPSELAQWPWSLLNAPSSHDAHSSEKKSCNSSAVRNAGDSEPSDAGTVAVAALWKCIAVSHNVRLIARAARIDDGPKRASRVRLLYAAPLILSPPLPLSSSSLSSSNAHSEPSKNEDGVQAPPLPSWHGGVDQEGRSLSAGPYSAGWCSVREHGIAFSFDLTRVMFCSGNVTERKRMAAPPTSLALHARVGGALGPVVTTAIIAATAAVAAPATGPATGPSSASTTASAVGRPKKNGHSGPWDALLPVPPQSASQACDSQQANCAAEGGEVIVDLYAGIGYYTLPFLVHFGHKVKHLHACEWNPDSIVALRFNIAAHHVTDKCTVYPGDNRLTVHCRAAPTTTTQTAPSGERHTATSSNDGIRSDGTRECNNCSSGSSISSGNSLGLRGCADRVNLGLIPSSSQGWPLACAALKPRGGWLHVHDNVHEDAVVSWALELAATMVRLGASEGEGREKWAVAVAHVEKVKSYAPRVMHVVADLFVYQRDDNSDKEGSSA